MRIAFIGAGSVEFTGQLVADILGCEPDIVHVRAGHDSYWNSHAGFSGTYASQFAVTGIYFYDADVFEVIPGLVPSGRGELEITDVNNWFIDRGTMEYDVLEGFWGDAGESIEAYYAVNDFVRTNGANKP